MSFFLAFALAVAAAASAGGKATKCTGQPNVLPVITTAPVLVKNATNGQLFEIAIGAGAPPLLVAHVWGTAYERGKAQGELLSAEVRQTLKLLYALVASEINHFVKNWPPVLQQLIDDLGIAGIDAALELTALATAPYSPQHFLDEVRGLADGAGLSYDELLRVSLVPELIKAACTQVGAWGTATTTGDLVQLRALDWSTASGFEAYPLLLVQHPSENGSFAFATLTWPGLSGGIGTNVNEASLATCEKYWYSYNGPSSRFGEPWNWVLRDVAQFASTNAEAVARIAKAHRTCSIFAGVGSRADNAFEIVEYSFDPLVIWNATSQPNYTPGHPIVTDVVYVDKNIQPSTDPCLGSLLAELAGQIDADVVLRNITAVHQTGDMHIMITTHGSPLTVHIANAAPTVNGPAKPAYNMPFVKINMDIEFARKNTN